MSIFSKTNISRRRIITIVSVIVLLLVITITTVTLLITTYNNRVASVINSYSSKLSSERWTSSSTREELISSVSRLRALSSELKSNKDSMKLLWNDFSQYDHLAASIDATIAREQDRVKVMDQKQQQEELITEQTRAQAEKDAQSSSSAPSSPASSQQSAASSSTSHQASSAPEQHASSKPQTATSKPHSTTSKAPTSSRDNYAGSPTKPTSSASTPKYPEPVRGKVYTSCPADAGYWNYDGAIVTYTYSTATGKWTASYRSTHDFPEDAVISALSQFSAPTTPGTNGQKVEHVVWAYYGGGHV